MDKLFIALLGSLFGVVLGVVLAVTYSMPIVQSKAAIAECERNLPCDQHCKFIATAIVVKGEK